MLSAEMEQFLEAELAESVNAGRRWRVIGNQTVMGRRRSPRINEPLFENLHGELGFSARGVLDSLRRLGDLDLPGDLDGWDGYPAARERFYNLAKEAEADGLIVLSGDSHGYFANALYDENDVSMGVELGTTGISSPRFLLDLGVDAAARWDELVTAHNREVVWTESRYRGYIRLDISHDAARADFIIVDNVESRDYASRILNSMDIIKTNGMLRYA